MNKHRYHIWIGTRLPEKLHFDHLGNVIAKVAEIAGENVKRQEPRRVRVFDTDPGWLHPLYDSKEAHT